MIGLIFGETDFPKYIYKKIKKKENYLIIDLTKKKIFKKDKNSYEVSIGQFGKIISIFKENDCKKVLFAGKVNKPKISKLKLPVPAPISIIFLFLNEVSESIFFKIFLSIKRFWPNDFLNFI